eukprot:scaffold48056_cov29-Tisochrysis_lutea.AAC.1
MASNAAVSNLPTSSSPATRSLILLESIDGRSRAACASCVLESTRAASDGACGPKSNQPYAPVDHALR